MSKEYILLVEDDKSIANIITILLEDSGFVVKWAPDLRSAFTLYNAEHPNLILLDYILPDGTPQEFVKHVGGTIPIILVTATGHAEAVAESLKIKNLLKKPFNLEEMLSAISKCISNNL